MFKRVLFKKLKATSEINIDDNIHSCDEWGIMPSEYPSAIGAKQKDLPKNEWLDENGDDEYIPDIPVFKSLEKTFTFSYRGENPVSDITAFLRYLSHGGAFQIYDEHSKIGYNNVRYVDYDPDAEDYSDRDESVIIFKVNLKINDPVTRITLTKD